MVAAVRIEITSTLTHEDEIRLASAVMRVLSGMLDMLPIAYLVRLETADHGVLEHVNTPAVGWDPVSAAPPTETLPVAES